MIKRKFWWITCAVVVLLAARQAPAQSCMGDVTGDRVVNAVDLATLLSQWSPNALGASCDLDGNGRVEGVDLGIMLAAWGPCPVPPAPVLTSVSPGEGPIVGGTQITIVGANLGGTQVVRVCGISASQFSVVNGSTISAITSSTGGSYPGLGSIEVVTGGGTATLPDAFRYLPPRPAPFITSVSPQVGRVTGGTAVTILGSNFVPPLTVAFCGVQAHDVEVLSATALRVSSPALPAGLCNVSVTTLGGTTTLEGAFRYTLGPYAPAWSSLIEEAPDISVVVHPQLREQIMATGYAWRVRDNARGIELVLIPPGAFERGCSSSSGWDCLSDESPVVPLTLTQPLYVGRYEVTQAQWIARYGSNPSFFQGSGSPLDRPVENVSWSNAQAFLSGSGLRLLTEAEWEYACRAGTTTAYHGNALQPLGSNADTFLDSIAWFDSNNSPYGTKSVGLKPGNGFGLHDMSGNVMEWVSDWYGAEYYAAAPPVNPTGPELGTLRILRGGSWGGSAGFCRSSRRYAVSPSLKNGSIGFRVARNP